MIWKSTEKDKMCNKIKLRIRVRGRMRGREGGMQFGEKRRMRGRRKKDR